MSQLIDPELEGRGGGYGRYRGMTLAEIQDRFDACKADPAMRSISAVLRIAREQVDARGELGIYPILAWVAGVICVLSLAVRPFAPEKTLELVTKVEIGSACAFVLLLVGSVPNQRARRVNKAQVQRILEMTGETLEAILEAEPALKPLTREQVQTLGDVVRKTAASERVRALLAANG